MRARFLFSAGSLVNEQANSGLPQRRTVTEGDRERFRDWLDRYSAMVKQRVADPDLLALGRELADWLNGPQGWLGTLIGAGKRPLELEFTIADVADDGAADFLSLPWELLTTVTPGDPPRFLAADPTLGFCPIRRLGTVATAASPPTDHALTVLFMAAAPEGESELSFEAEEAAILQCATRTNLDLVVEDGGTLADLTERFALEWPVEVLHLTCHGLAGRDGSPPMLALEDEVGGVAAVTPAGFLDAFGHERRPRLLFLSACETAADSTGVEPFVLPMLAAGQPAAIGWAGSVLDGDASAFAAALYSRLVLGDSLEAAMALARRALLAPADGGEPMEHWHLARLFLTGDGGGPMCAPRGKRRQRQFDHVEKRFFGNNRQVPVAGRLSFVGRRRDLQQGLRALRHRRPGCAGLFLQGAGHLGKSSLAARIADRLTGHEPAVVYGRCDVEAVVEALTVARPGFDDAVQIDAAALTAQPRRFYTLLRNLLDGPLRDQPVLLVLDDFEQMLGFPPGGLPTLQAEAAPVLDALLRAFADHDGDSGVIVTCRNRFSLPAKAEGSLLDLSLRPFGSDTRWKQAMMRLRAAALPAGLTRELLNRCLQAARGNPGLQDVLLALALREPAQAEAAVAQFDGWLAGAGRPDDETIARRLEHLTLDRLWDCLSAGERALLRAVTLFTLPVPLPVLEELARARGLPPVTLDRLLALAALDLYPDPVDPTRHAAASGHLLRPRLDALPLPEAEEAAAIRAALPALFREWGGSDGSRRPDDADLMLAELAARVAAAAVLQATAKAAVNHLSRSHRYRRAAALGKRAVELIDAAGLNPPPQLLRHAAASALQTGDAAFARIQLRRALDGLPEESDPRHLGSIRGEFARLLVQDGRPDEALPLFEKNLDLYRSLGDVRSKAVTLGDIAGLKASRGAVEEALALYQEIVAIFEALGEVRERAVTLGYIARLKASRGAVEEAMVLHRDILETYRSSEARRDEAIALGDIARLEASRGAVEEALALHQEELGIYEALGDVRGRALTLGDIARLKASRGAVEEALVLYQELIAIFEALGDVHSRAVTLGDVARLKASRGAVEEALVLYQEMIAIFEALGDVRSRAVTLGDIARLRASRGAVEEALAIHQERIAIFESLGDVRSRAVTLGDIARLRASRGAVEEALAIDQERIAIFEALGDVDGQANAHWSIAKLRLQSPSLDAAGVQAVLEDLDFAYDALNRTGRADGVAVVGFDLAQLLAQIGGVDEARALAEHSLALFKQLGWPDWPDHVQAFLDSLPPPEPDAP